MTMYEGKRIFQRNHEGQELRGQIIVTADDQPLDPRLFDALQFPRLGLNSQNSLWRGMLTDCVTTQGSAQGHRYSCFILRGPFGNNYDKEKHPFDRALSRFSAREKKLPNSTLAIEKASGKLITELGQLSANS